MPWQVIPVSVAWEGMIQYKEVLCNGVAECCIYEVYNSISILVTVLWQKPCGLKHPSIKFSINSRWCISKLFSKLWNHILFIQQGHARSCIRAVVTWDVSSIKLISMLFSIPHGCWKCYDRMQSWCSMKECSMQYEKIQCVYDEKLARIRHSLHYAKLSSSVPSHWTDYNCSLVGE